MKRLVVLGLSLSSSWGNGHATTFRAILMALAKRGWDILFLERDVPWYAEHRDQPDPGYCRLDLYNSVASLERWAPEVHRADAVIVGSYVPQGVQVGEWALRNASGPVAFYDIDTPVTLAKLAAGDDEYLSASLIERYDLYLSFTGGRTLDRLQEEFRSPLALPLYCSVDSDNYRPMPEVRSRWDLSYLGTYSADRQPTLDRLLIEAARIAPDLRFVVAGPQYPSELPWPENVERLDHVPPAEHPAFYAASRYTLNVTRADMISAGWSPSVRLFEAAACETPIISDWWEGLDELLAPGSEILFPGNAEEVVSILRDVPDERRTSIGRAARARVLAAHTAAHRAAELETYLLQAARLKSRAA